MREIYNQHIAIYSRKSKFTGKGESIENQIELCRQYIRIHFINCTEECIHVYEDEGFSGGNLERPKLKKMMTDARQKKFSSIVCYRLDRISRNIGDFAKLIEELEAMNIAFVSIKEQFDTSSPMGRAMMYISSVFSQLERETIAERIRDNMRELSKTGRWLGGTSPTGYVSESVENVTIDGKKKRSCRLKVVPEEADIVKKIYGIFLETNSLSQTETYLLKNGFKSKNGRRFTRFAIRNILANPVYMIADDEAYDFLVLKETDLFADKTDFDGKHGVMAYNRTIQKKGKTNVIRSMSEWVIAVGKHTGLVNGAEWVKAQESLDLNRSKAYRKPRSNTSILSGLLFCARCGGYMRPKAYGKMDKLYEPSFNYICSTKERSRSQQCNMINIKGNLLDEAVYEEVKNIEDDRTEFVQCIMNGKRFIEKSQEEYDDNLDQLYDMLTENDKEIASLVSSLAKASGTPAETYITAQINELHEKGKEMQRRINLLEAAGSKYTLSDTEAKNIIRLLSSLKDIMSDMEREQKRYSCRLLINRIIWDGDDVHIYLYGSEDNGI